MNATPFVFGGPQIVLLLLGLAGLGLLIYALMGLRGERVYRRHPYRDDEEAERKGWYDRRENWRYRRRHRLGHGIGGLFLVLIAVLLLWLVSLMQTYIGLTSDIQVAQVRAHTVSNSGGVPMMSVELTLLDQSGHQLSDNTYIVMGDEWMLEGDIIKYPGWLNIFGLHSGYKLTRLEGRFDDPNLERNSKHTVVELNGGDDNFFKTMRNQRGWINPFIDATYGNAVFLPADGNYNVFVSQTGLWAKRA